jgi:mono/diheme cytochrome c family protein
VSARTGARPRARSGARAALAQVAALLLWLAVAPSEARAQDVARGEYLAQAGGCLGCHVEARAGATPFAGGRALKSPFGTFFGPNITPHPEAGIGRWTEADFRRAMRDGKRPDGSRYFPAFPYVAFTRISDADLRDLWAYLRSLPPSPQPNGRTTSPSRTICASGWCSGISCISRPALCRTARGRHPRCAAAIWQKRWAIAANATRRAAGPVDCAATPAMAARR